MKFNDYLNNEMFQKIQDFFIKYPKPEDKQIHQLSDDLKIDVHQFEEIIYFLLGSFFGAGKSQDFKGEYNKSELAKGIKVEMEHTNNTFIAEKIAKDHLAEFDDYYTRLAKMEKEAKSND